MHRVSAALGSRSQAGRAPEQLRQAGQRSPDPIEEHKGAWTVKDGVTRSTHDDKVIIAAWASVELHADHADAKWIGQGLEMTIRCRSDAFKALQ